MTKTFLLLTAAFFAAPAMAQDLGAPIGEDQRVESVAVEGEEGQESIRLKDRKKGTEHVVPFAEISDARLAFHWKP